MLYFHAMYYLLMQIYEIYDININSKAHLTLIPSVRMFCSDFYK